MEGEREGRREESREVGKEGERERESPCVCLLRGCYLGPQLQRVQFSMSAWLESHGDRRW